ncbi:MAG: HIT family protein [bacterium]
MSLTLTYDPENIFAKMLRDEIPYIPVYEDDEVLSFMDIFPQTKGHCLVIPKNVTATNILTIESDKLATTIKRTQKIANAVNQALYPDGIRIVQYNGEAAGQSVFHIHFHIIPITAGQPIGAHGGRQAEQAELEALATKIRACL